MVTIETQKFLQEIFILAIGRGAGKSEMAYLAKLTESDSLSPLLEAINAYMSGLAASQGSAATVKQLAMNGLELTLDDNTATTLAGLIDGGQKTWADFFIYCTDLKDDQGLALDNRAEAAYQHLADLEHQESLLLQKVFILATGRAAGEAEMAFLKQQLATGSHAPLIEAVNGYMNSLGSTQGNAETLKQLAMNGLNLNLDDATASAFAEQIASGQTTWANLFAYCIGLNDPLGQVLGNRAEAAQTFLDKLEAATKAGFYAGGAVNQLVKNLLLGIDGSAASLEAGKSGFEALLARLSADGIKTSVVDGYIKSANVFIDSNGNGTLDTDEFNTTTGEDGSYQLPANAVDGKVIAYGGTDLLTMKPFKGVLTAPFGSTMVSPLTTLLQAQLDAGASLTQAEAKLQQALGLPANVNLLTYDPLAVLINPAAESTEKTTALSVQKVSLQLANLMTLAAVALDIQSTSGTLLSSAQTLVAKLLVQLTNSETLDLGSAGTLQQIIQTAATDLGISATDAESLANSLGSLIANLNGKAALATTFSALSKVAVVAQSTAADTIVQTLNDGHTLDTIIPNFSGNPLDILLSNPRIIGTPDNDSIYHGDSVESLIISGQGGNDKIQSGAGNDVIHPGEGADNVNTGAGNDIVVVLGQTGAGEYNQSDISNPGGSGIDLSSVISLADLNGRTVSEIQPGESIDGGAGTNRLVIYGNIDLSGVTLSNITQFQVNSSLTLSAQQLNTLPLTLMFGDGESILNISNDSDTTVTVDLSGVNLADFRTLNIASGVTVIVDQADVASLLHISGKGVIQASADSGTLDLTGKQITVGVQDKDGYTDDNHGGGLYMMGDITIGGEGNDSLTGSAEADRLEGGFGDDSLSGGDGNDILRGGAGIDTMEGGAGDDRFVIVGDISGGGKVDSDEDTAALGFPLTNLNFVNLNEDSDGATEVIRGGDGEDTLYVYGTADLSNYDITGIEHIEIRSDVTFSVGQLTGLTSLIGDGSSVLRIDNAATPIVLDLTQLAATTGLSLFKLGEISIGNNVTLKISSTSELGGATILTGSGTIQSDTGQLTLSNTYSVQNTLTFTNINADQTEKLAEVVTIQAGYITDTSGNDYLKGTDVSDIFRSINGGDDVLTGKKGNDIFIIAGSGKKIILDVANADNGSDQDTIDLSQATAPAIINLTNGGMVGNATIQLGSGNATGGTQQTAPKFNLMLIMDVSGSMGSYTTYPSTRLDDAKSAAKELIDAYDKIGDVSVRIVTFGRDWPEAGSDFNGKDEWMTSDSAKSIIDTLYYYGGTPYDLAMDVAQIAFLSGTGNLFYQNGNNVSFFLSDGEPNDSIYYKETDWENFLIENKISSSALGFGGLNSTYELEPLAFDGTKINSITSDHSPGEIPAQLTLDTSNIGKNLITQAKLDFIENLTGTDFDDELNGNSLGNNIDGNFGDDTIYGGEGEDILNGGPGVDTARYSGKISDYEITNIGPSQWKIADLNKNDGDDGTDLLSSIEEAIFANEENYSFYATDDTLKTSINSGTESEYKLDSIQSGTVADYVRSLLVADSAHRAIDSWGFSGTPVIHYSFSEQKTSTTYPQEQNNGTFAQTTLTPTTPWKEISWLGFGSEVDKEAKTAIKQALDIYSSYINIDFKEEKTDSNADFHFYLVDKDFLVSYGYDTKDADSILGRMTFPSYGNKTGWADDAGTMFLKEQTDWSQGNDNFQTIMHELGHGLGLNHSHSNGTYNGITDDIYFPGAVNKDTSGDYGLNDMIYSQMSYISKYKPIEPNTPMPLDVFSLQLLYGPQKNSHTGDTTYYLSDAAGLMYTTIWDTDGIDTITASNIKKNVTIDLRPADINLTDTVSNDGKTYSNNFGYLSGRNDVDGGYYVASDISYNGTTYETVLERAIGGSGDDILIGNNTFNSLIGNNGSDTIDGGDLDDFIQGGRGADKLTGGVGNDIFYFSSLDELETFSGNDLITDFQTGHDKIWINTSDHFKFSGSSNENRIEFSNHKLSFIINGKIYDDSYDLICSSTPTISEDDIILGETYEGHTAQYYLDNPWNLYPLI